jgi:PAS domain S-box-containing protein
VPDPDEDSRLRATALQNAQSILIARRRAEEELRQHSEWLRTTLASIADGVITTDADGRVTFMNAVAEALTDWSLADALGQFLPDVFQIVDEGTRETIGNAAIRALQTGGIVRLANHAVLISRHGRERPIDDGAAPIRDTSGATVGAVLVFRDASERKASELEGPGTGSTFTITLPVLPSSRPSSRLDAPPESPSLAAPSRRILVVDDNRDAADSMASMLELLGQEVQTAYGGAEAVTAAASFQPALILMDIGMPGLNGYDATRQIRAQASGQSVKVIALTGWGQEQDRTRSRDAGCDGHLVKPVDVAELERLLRT